MDSHNFRKPTSPNLFPDRHNPIAATQAVKRMEAPMKATYPIDDPRYPGYASIMDDGRLVTDYKSHCAAYGGLNPRYGNSVRGFLQHNGDAIVQVSRKRQADRAGAQFKMANTVIEPRLIQKCDEYECMMSRNRSMDSVGLNRSEPVPALFGTFSHARVLASWPQVPLTTKFEGGRNTPHGRDYAPLGLKSFNPRNSQYGSSG